VMRGWPAVTSHCRTGTTVINHSRHGRLRGFVLKGSDRAQRP